MATANAPKMHGNCVVFGMIFRLKLRKYNIVKLYTHISCIACKILGDPKFWQMNLNKRDQKLTKTDQLLPSISVMHNAGPVTLQCNDTVEVYLYTVLSSESTQGMLAWRR